MSRIFKRPMFRKGGNVGTGIMTGIVDRSMHAENPFVGGFQGMEKDYGKEANILNQTYDNNQYTPLPISEEDTKATSPVLTTKKDMTMPEYSKPDFGTERDASYYIDQLKKGGGEYGGMDPLTSFLLTAGPAITQATSFGDAISKLGPANQALIEQANKKAEYLRELGLTGTKMSLANEEKIEGRKYNYGIDLNDKEYAYASKMNERLYNEKATGVTWAREALKEKEKLNREDWLSQQAAILSKANAADAKAWEIEMEKNKQGNEIALIKKRSEETQAINAAERKLDNADYLSNSIKDAVVKIMDGDQDLSLKQATNMANWTYKLSSSPALKNYKVGGVLDEINTSGKKAKGFAKKEAGKGNNGKVFWDPYTGDGRALQVQLVEGEYDLVEISLDGESSSPEKIIETPEVVEDKTLYETITGKKPVPTSYEDMLKDTEETTQKIKDVITTPIDMSKIDTTNTRKYRR